MGTHKALITIGGKRLAGEEIQGTGEEVDEAVFATAHLYGFPPEEARKAGYKPWKVCRPPG
jgi:hypothetical protein